MLKPGQPKKCGKSQQKFNSFWIFTLWSKVLVAQLCPTLWDPMDYSPPGSSIHGILQARILEWLAMPSSRRSSRPRDRTQVSCITGRFFTIWATLVQKKSLPEMTLGFRPWVCRYISGYRKGHVERVSPFPLNPKPQQHCFKAFSSQTAWKQGKFQETFLFTVNPNNASPSFQYRLHKSQHKDTAFT